MEPSGSSAKQAAAHLSGVILAGGKGSRFGRDKSRMELAGKRVLGHLGEVLRRFPFERLALITASGKGEGAPEDFVTLTDDQEGLGPIGGITTALRRLPGGILVTACDMPLVSVPVIEWLLSEYDPRAGAIIPRHSAGIEPLVGIYGKGLLPRLEEAIRSGRYALHFVLEDSQVRFVKVPERFSAEREFANINTREDYERVLKLMGSLRPGPNPAKSNS